MDQTTLTLAVFAGIALRISIPLVITIFLAFVMRKLDEHWQEEAEHLPVFTPAENMVNSGCWDSKGCTDEMKSGCVAFAHPETPCWQFFRADDGRLADKCVGCDVFMQPTVPIKAPVRVRA